MNTCYNNKNNNTSIDHDIELSDKHITGLIDPVVPSGAVTKQHSEGEIALAVNELMKKLFEYS